MTDPVKEQLSACLDGELPEGELDLLLKQLERDPQLRQALGDYARVGEVLRGERPATASAGFAARVSAAIAAETGATAAPEPVRAPRATPVPLRWLRPAIGMAIAAGVAAVAVLTVQPSSAPEQQVAQSIAPEAESVQPDEQSSYTVPTNTASSAFVPAARLTNYVVAHSEYSSPLGRRTVLTGVLSEGEQAQDGNAAADGESQTLVTQPDADAAATRRQP